MRKPMKYVVAGRYTTNGEWMESWYEALGPYLTGDPVYLNREAKADPNNRNNMIAQHYVGAAMRMDNELPYSTSTFEP